MEYRFTLEKYSGPDSRYVCPGCGKKEFTRYIDTDTNQHIAPSVGMCNRKNNCGYHYIPSQFFADKGAKPPPLKKTFNFNQEEKSVSKKVNHINIEMFKKSLKDYDENNFVKFLINQFGNGVATGLTEKYFIGTSGHLFFSKNFPGYKSTKGASIFWQIDTAMNIRGGKVIQYSPDSGKRLKVPFDHVQWAHSITKIPDYELHQCFFGEHLLEGNNKPVCIVEAEKSAIVATAYYPDINWLASGGLEGLNEDKFRVLHGRSVTLCPDLKGYDKWCQKAFDLSHITSIKVSDYLEKIATEDERKQSLDIADYLLLLDLNGARKQVADVFRPDTMSEYIGELWTMSNRFSNGEITLGDWSRYNLEFERRIKANNINLEEFVAKSIAYRP